MQLPEQFPREKPNFSKTIDERRIAHDHRFATKEIFRKEFFRFIDTVIRESYLNEVCIMKDRMQLHVDKTMKDISEMQEG
jgi:hypothetical protein